AVRRRARAVRIERHRRRLPCATSARKMTRVRPSQRQLMDLRDLSACSGHREVPRAQLAADAEGLTWQDTPTIVPPCRGASTAAGASSRCAPGAAPSRADDSGHWAAGYRLPRWRAPAIIAAWLPEPL